MGVQYKFLYGNLVKRHNPIHENKMETQPTLSYSVLWVGLFMMAKELLCMAICIMTNHLRNVGTNAVIIGFTLLFKQTCNSAIMPLLYDLALGHVVGI